MITLIVAFLVLGFAVWAACRFAGLGCNPKPSPYQRRCCK